MFKAIYNFFHHHYHTRYHGIYRHAKKLFVFDLGLMAMAIIMLGASIFFFFWKPTITDLIDLNFSFGSARLLSGDQMQISIDYKNRSKLLLEDAIMAVHLPAGFVVDRTKTPESVFAKNSTVEIGKIAPGGTGRIEIYGTIFAEQNKDQKVTAYLTYKPENKKDKEQKIGAAFLRTVGATLSAELSIPASSFPNRDIAATLTIKNNGKTTLANISIQADLIKPFAADETLKNITLAPGESKSIPGIVRSPGTSGKYPLKFSFNISANNTPITVTSLEKSLDVFYPEIKSGLKSLFDKTYLDGNDTLRLRVYWNNSGQYEVKNPRLRFSFTPGVVDLRATARENNLTVSGADLIADKKTRTAFANGKPGASDEFEIKLILLPFFRTDNQTKLEVKVYAEAELPDVPGQQFSSESSESVQLPLATQLAWRVRPVYYTNDGDQLGRGPLPPSAGETTKYWIFVEIDNSVNPIAQNSFRATLGNGVEFTGKQSVTIGPEIKYDGSFNAITWNYNLAPAFGTIGLYFEVAVKPNASQIGKKIILLNNLSYTALDDVINKQMNLFRGPLDNTLSDEDQGSAARPEVSQ